MFDRNDLLLLGCLKINIDIRVKVNQLEKSRYMSGESILNQPTEENSL